MTEKNRHSKMIGKLRSSAAFTLAEMLVAILIMLMVSGIVAGGIPAAQRAYEGAVKSSNAEVLLSTTISALKGKLSIASSVELESDNKAITFYNPDTHSNSRIYLKDGTGDIMFTQVWTGGADDSSEPLVPDAAKEEGQYPSYTSVEVKGKVVTFHGLSVKEGEGINAKVIASLETKKSGDETGEGATVDPKNGDISFRVLSVGEE